jgi:cytochrome P450
MTPTCRYLGLNIAGYLGFGYDLSLQTNDVHRFITNAITFGNYRVNTTMQFTPLSQLRPGVLMDLFPNSLRAKLMAILRKMITSRLAQPPDAKQDLLSVFTVQSDVSIKNLRQESLWTEAVFFFAAGSYL